MDKQLQFELVEDQILLEGFVHTKGNKTEVIEDVLVYRNPKTRKFIKVEKGGTKFHSNIFGSPKHWPKEELQEYVNLLLESSRLASDINKKKEVFFTAKSYVSGMPTFANKFNGRGIWREFSNEENNYIKTTEIEAEHFFATGECSFALQRN